MSNRIYYSSLKNLCKNICPDYFLQYVIRKRIKINYALPSNVKISLAKTSSEIKKTKKMLYESYLHVGKINPNERMEHYLPDNLINQTQMIIVKKDDDIIGTVSLVKRGPNKLPCEDIYDISQIASSGRPIYELSCLAIDQKSRSMSKDLIFALFKTAYTHINKTDPDAIFAIIVNPKYAMLYKAIFGFQFVKDGKEIRPCKKSNNFPVNCLYLDLNEARKNLHKTYGHKSAIYNLYYYFTEFTSPNFCEDFVFDLKPSLDTRQFDKSSEFFIPTVYGANARGQKSAVN